MRVLDKKAHQRRNRNSIILLSFVVVGVIFIGNMITHSYHKKQQEQINDILQSIEDIIDEKTEDRYRKRESTKRWDDFYNENKHLTRPKNWDLKE